MPADATSDRGLGEGETIDASGGSAPAVEIDVGSVIDRYVILASIGRGGMGVVYGAYDPELDRRIALKLLHEEVEAEGKLLREAQALAMLTHPNIVVVHDVGVHAGRTWIAMELVEGRTLSDWLDERARTWPE